MGRTREPAVEGLFYPSSLDEVNFFMKSFEENIPILDNTLTSKLRILISPHAGIVYSGQTASFGFSLLKERQFKRIICFAPSHRVAFRGISIGDYDFYKFCDQIIPIDKEYFGLLTKEFKDIKFLEEAHKNEHSSELQLPFLNYFVAKFNYLSFVYSEYDPKEMAKIMEFILSDEDNLIIISSDLSHFHTYDTALKIDGITIDSVLSKDLNSLEEVGEACGMQGIKAATIAAKKLNYTPKLLDYRNSGDTGGDKTSVVGYASIAYMS